MPIVSPGQNPSPASVLSNHFIGLVWQALVSDVADTSAANPCLLTLANQSPSRLQLNQLLGASTIATGGAAAGATTIPVVNALNFAAQQWLYVGGLHPEVVQVSPTYSTGASIPLVNPLVNVHLAGDLVSGLASVVYQSEPRQVITTPAAYWLISLMSHEYPDPSIKQRAPVRNYEAILTVKLYDASPSRKLLEDVCYRLDFLLNLGEAGMYGTAPLLGTSPRLFVESLEAGQNPEPHFDYATTVQQVPLVFTAKYSVTYS